MINIRKCQSCGRSESRVDAKFCSDCATPFTNLTQNQGAQLPTRDSNLIRITDNGHDGIVVHGITHKNRSGFEGKTMLDLIRSGHRKAITRYANVFDTIQVGDLLRLTRSKDNVTVKVAALPYPSQAVSPDEWSILEGLDKTLYEKLYGQADFFQLRFDLFNPNPTDPQGKPIHSPRPVNMVTDNKRRFRLPEKTLTEQDFALDLPEDGFHLLIGGPGTGKSVIALLRASRLARKNRNHIFLAYNRLLVHASRSLDCNTLKEHSRAISTETWMAWFRKKWKELMGNQCPQFGSPYDLDWPSIRLQLDEKINIPPPKESHLVIDEGQDMPVDFYEALASMGYENIFVVADFNQALEPKANSNYPDLCNVLLKNKKLRFCASTEGQVNSLKEHVVQLSYNHRNSFPVARLARAFYTGDPQSPPPELPPPTRTADVPVLVTFDDKDEGSFSKIIRRILLTANDDPKKLIGIICPDKTVLQRYEQSLLNIEIDLSNGIPPISSHTKNASQLPDFTIGGIILLCAQGCKGLEFDYVIIADIDQFKYWKNIDKQQKMLFYVMVSRAIKRVILIQNLANPCPISAILPSDPNILARN